jgi:hypothetical protein
MALLSHGKLGLNADLVDNQHASDFGTKALEHVAVTLGGGSDAALSLSGQVLTLANVLTPTEHSAIGDGAPHHAAITLDTNADTLLSLSTQSLGLDTQVKNRVFAGPWTGADGVPGFRALVSNDIPTLDHGDKITGLSDDDHQQYLLASGGRTGASSQAQFFTNGIVGPSWKPAGDSTVALQLQNAAGTPIVTVDTTNGRVDVGNLSTAFKLSVYSVATTGDGAYVATAGHTLIALRTINTNDYSSGIAFEHTGGTDATIKQHFYYNALQIASVDDIVFERGGIGAGSSFPYEYMRIKATEVVVNDRGDSTIDFRVESDAHDALFVDASADALRIGVGLYLPTKTIVVADSPYTVLAADYTIRCNCVSGAITVALPEATGSGRILNIKKIDASANAVTVDGYSTNTIDGAATVDIGTQYANMQIQDAAAGVWDIL